MNVDDKEFLLQLLTDIEGYLGDDNFDGIYDRLERARTILERNYFHEREEHYRDWHQEALDFEDDDRHDSDSD